MTAHSTIGASSCERWWNCPGSVALVATMPPQKPSAYAEEGTDAHALAELCLKEGKDPIAGKYFGRVISDALAKSVEITAEMADAVQIYLNVIREDMHNYGVSAKDLKVEHKFHLSHVDPDAFGTNDANLPVFLTKLIVYDLKYGQGVAVEAEENKQAMYYALGAVQGEYYEEIEVVIVQPRAIHKDGPVRRWTITRAQLQEFEDELKLKIQETKKKDAPLCPGNWCRKTFCPAMARCPAIKQEVESAAMIAFDDYKEDPKPLSAEVMSDEQLTRVLHAMPRIEQWLKEVYAFAEAKANRGEKVPGFKLVRGREGNRKWKDETEVALAFGDTCYEKVVMSPSKLEKIIKDKEAKSLINKLTSRAEAKTTLVPDSDPREEVQPNASLAFSDPFQI